jgi:hypothetical protein
MAARIHQENYGFGSLLLLLGLFGPGRHNSIYTRVGDGLSEVLAKVSGDGDKGSAQRSVTVEHVLWLVGIGLVEGDDGATEMCEGVFQCLQDLWLIS